MNTAKAEAEMAYGLQASKVQARIMEENMQVRGANTEIKHVDVFKHNLCR